MNTGFQYFDARKQLLYQGVFLRIRGWSEPANSNTHNLNFCYLSFSRSHAPAWERETLEYLGTQTIVLSFPRSCVGMPNMDCYDLIMPNLPILRQSV